MGRPPSFVLMHRTGRWMNGVQCGFYAMLARSTGHGGHIYPRWSARRFILPARSMAGTLLLPRRRTRGISLGRFRSAIWRTRWMCIRSGCSEQDSRVRRQKFELGVTYDPKGNDLTLTITAATHSCGGAFRPTTPRYGQQQIQESAVSASCYLLRQVLGSKGGVTGIVRGVDSGR